MVEACAAAGVVLQVGFNQRYWNQVRIAKTLIEQGVIGKVHGFRSIYAERWNVYPAATRYRYDLALSGGATIIDLTIHRIDLVRHLLGEFRSVMAELAHSVVPDPIDDNVWLLARLESGARGCLSSDRYSPAIGDGTDIYGSEGTIHLATETLNPFHAVPLAVHTERKAADLPEVLREAHYPEAWWKGFEGGWITLKPPRANPYDAQLARLLPERADRDGPLRLRRGRAQGAGGRPGRLSGDARGPLGRPAAAARRALPAARLCRGRLRPRGLCGPRPPSSFMAHGRVPGADADDPFLSCMALLALGLGLAPALRCRRRRVRRRSPFRTPGPPRRRAGIPRATSTSPSRTAAAARTSCSRPRPRWRRMPWSM